MNEKETITYINIFKCENESCRLEFAIFSWKDNWSQEFKPFCPECGKQEAHFLHRIESDKPIYEVVCSGWGENK